MTAAENLPVSDIRKLLVFGVSKPKLRLFSGVI